MNGTDLVNLRSGSFGTSEQNQTNQIETPIMSRPPRMTDAFRWRLAIGAILIAGGYAAWLIIPVVVASDLSPDIKSGLAAFLGATPLLTKLIAIALLGRPTINFLKKHSFRLFRRSVGDGD